VIEHFLLKLFSDMLKELFKSLLVLPWLICCILGNQQIQTTWLICIIMLGFLPVASANPNESQFPDIPF
jgi:hypothetical protein